uniref:Uncharacterized protein n=1 Tax=Anguilla anguilla TaxID=7936 RepID=A0A0E9QMX1_ANGAN
MLRCLKLQTLGLLLYQCIFSFIRRTAQSLLSQAQTEGVSNFLLSICRTKLSVY